MHARGKVDRPLRADYLTVDTKVDAYKTLWKKRVVLGWYPGKTSADTHLAAFLLENVRWRTGAIESVAILDAGGHSLRSLSIISGLPVSSVGSILLRWVNLGFIARCRIGERRRGSISINWEAIGTGIAEPLPVKLYSFTAEQEVRSQTGVV